MTAAVFQATYADWRVIKGRKVVSISFEVPIEQADLAYQVVGGMPNPALSAWFAIARLVGASTDDASRPNPDSQKGGSRNPGGGHEVSRRNAQPRNETGRDEPTPAQSHKSWHDISSAQQAGVLCNDQAFQRFLNENMPIGVGPCIDAETAAQIVREHCGVLSRTEIDKHQSAKDRWKILVTDFRAWMREPELVG